MTTLAVISDSSFNLCNILRIFKGVNALWLRLNQQTTEKIVALIKKVRIIFILSEYICSITNSTLGETSLVKQKNEPTSSVKHLLQEQHLHQSCPTMIISNLRLYQTKQKYQISQYHVRTAKLIADTALHMRLPSLNKCQLNDVTKFNLTKEHHRLRTFNNKNWDRTVHDVTDLAKNGFFSLSKTTTYIQCFSCGIIITKFLPNVPIFLFHWLASPDCKHFHLRDDTNVPDQQSQSKTSHTGAPANNILEVPPETHNEFLMQEAGFTRISTLQIPLDICPSCQGQYEAWTTLFDPWKFHPQHFPHCPHVIKFKSPPFIITCLKQYKHSTVPRRQYNQFFQRHLQYLRPETFCTDLLYVSNVGTFHNLLQNLTKHHEIFMHVLHCYAIPMTDPSS